MPKFWVIKNNPHFWPGKLHFPLKGLGKRLPGKAKGTKVASGGP